MSIAHCGIHYLAVWLQFFKQAFPVTASSDMAESSPTEMVAFSALHEISLCTKSEEGALHPGNGFSNFQFSFPSYQVLTDAVQRIARNE